MLSDTELKIQREISGLHIKKNVEDLVRAGADRFVGTPGDKAAIGFVRKRFQALGLEVVETPIRVPSWQETKPPALRIERTGELLEGISPSFGVSTPPAGITADLVLIRGREGHCARGARGPVGLSTASTDAAT